MIRCPACSNEVPDGSRFCPSCRRDLETATSTSRPPERDSTRTEPPPSSETARVIGPYRLLEKIGEGGMGEVWAAEQQEPVRRRVALKIIKRGMDTKEVIARFGAERQALATMNHSSVARIFDAGETPRGRPFFVMEYVEGVPITEQCDRQRLTLKERLELFVQVCAGVQHAHQKAIIHRDLKPSNVLVAIQDGETLPKIIDFGVSKATAQHLTERTVYTELGVLIGTPEYMSPEQAEMTGQSVDTRTDVYSLGVILYELLVGALPFETKRLRQAGFDEIRRVIREEEPSRPSTRVGTLEGVRLTELLRRRRTDRSSLIRQLRGDLDWIAMKALEKNRSRRYGSPQELAADIQRYLMSDPVMARPPSAGYRVRKFARRHPTTARWIGLVFVAAAAVLLGYLAASRSDRGGQPAAGATFDDRSIAVLPFENLGGAEENAAFTAGIHADILNRVAKISDLLVISRASVMDYRATTKNLRQIRDELGVATVLEGVVQRSGDQVRIHLRLLDAANDRQLWAESFDRELSAEQVFSIQSEVAGQVAAALHATLSADERRRIDRLPTANLAAYDAYLEGLQYLDMPDYVEANLVRASGNFRQAVALDPEFALAWAGLSRAARDRYWMTGGPPEALETTRQAATRALELQSDLSEAHLALGTYSYVVRDYDTALEHLSIAEQGLPGDSELMRWKAYILRRRGMWDEALQELRRARLRDPRDIEAMSELAFTLLVLGRYEEAERYFAQTLDLVPGHHVATTYRSLIPWLRDGTDARARTAADSIEKAADVPWQYIHGWQAMVTIGEFERAARFVSVPERVTGQWYDYPRSLLLGWTYRLAGRESDAREQFSAAMRLLEGEVIDRPEDARLRAALGIAYAGLGRSEEAIASGRRAVDLMPIAKDVFVGTWVQQDLAWIYVMTGRHDDAVETFDELLSMPALLSIELLLTDPRVDPLRDDAGFRSLVRKHRRF